MKHEKNTLENTKTKNIEKEIETNHANKKNKTRLNKTWQQIFSKALRPPTT